MKYEEEVTYWLLKKFMKSLEKISEKYWNITVHKFYAISLVNLSVLGLIIGFNLIYFH